MSGAAAGRVVRQAELRTETLVELTNKTNWQWTNREHRYKYTEDNREDGRHLDGVETIRRTGKTDQGGTGGPPGGLPGLIPG